MVSSEAEILAYTLLAFAIFDYIFNIYLSIRQIRVLKNEKEVPEQLAEQMDSETFEKARQYGLEKEYFRIRKSIIMLAILSIESYLNTIAIVWNLSESIMNHMAWDGKNEISISILFTLLFNFLQTLKMLPLELYKTFVIEERNGFNKQTIAFFISDQMKTFCVTQVIELPIVATVIFIIEQTGDNFFLWLWVFSAIHSMILFLIYPILIAPIFDNFSPMEDGSLKEAIEELAASVEFPLAKLYIIEGSKRSGHSNAYVGGLWKSKRIVLYDTLLISEENEKGCTNEEVLAVLAHELGHWKLGHMRMLLIGMELDLMIRFLFARYFFTFTEFFETLGFASCSQPILVRLLIIFSLILKPYDTWMQVFMNRISRSLEYQADEFACQIGHGKKLKDALIKLYMNNLSFPITDPLYVQWKYSHPTLLNRLMRVDEVERKKE